MIYSLALKYNNKKYYKNYSIKIGKFRRAMFTRIIAIIPSLIIVFLDNAPAFNNYLNLL